MLEVRRLLRLVRGCHHAAQPPPLSAAPVPQHTWTACFVNVRPASCRACAFPPEDVQPCHVHAGLLPAQVEFPACREGLLRLLSPLACRYCTLNPQKRSAEVTANILNQHAAAAAKLQAKFRAAVAAANTAASSCGSALPQPHITRPHTSSAAAAMPAGVPALGSGLAVQRVAGGSSSSTIEMPASPRRLRSVVAHAVATAKLGDAGHTVVGSGSANSCGVCSSLCSRSRSSSPVRSRPTATVIGAGPEPHQAAVCSWQQQQQQQGAHLQPPTPTSQHECDSSSEDEADFDSDSEVMGWVQA